jgi:hypothetical protein
MDETVEQVKRDTPTETLIKVMEQFSQDEPTDVCVVCLDDKKGQLWLTQNTESDVKSVGMLEIAKTIITDEMGDVDEGDEGKNQEPNAECDGEAWYRN